MMQREEFSKAVLSKVTEADYVHKVFLKPLEVELKNDRQSSIGDLAHGLMNAFKPQSISEDCYETMEFQPLDPQLSLQLIEKQQMNNLISYLKMRDPSRNEGKKLELAICVCMYSQNKTMLKDSIKGIEDNIAKLINTGVDPDSIAVFVLMDGIEKVDGSIPDYFEELERESHIFLGQNNIPSYSNEDIQAERNNKNYSDYTHQFAAKNVNSFLFDKAQLFERQERRFENVRKEYLQASKLRNILSKLKSDNNEDLLQKMPSSIKKEFFDHEARLWKQRQCRKKGQNVQYKDLISQTQKIIEQYRYDKQKTKIIATEAINKALIKYNKYIQTRDSLCYVATYRKKIYLPIYEPKTQAMLIQQNENSLRYMNLFMCVKYKNGGKLSSHNWFFNGFCNELSPSFTILMDVGLKPEKESIFKMYSHMKKNPNVGGVCGYMRLKIEQVEDEDQVKDEQVDWLSAFTLNFVDIQKAQQLQYNFAHIIDKPFESAFKFIHVLPGAFSGYSMQALKSQDNQDKLLKEYFRSIESKLVQNNIKQSDITLVSVLLRVLLPQFFFNLLIGVQPQSQQQMLYNQNIFFAQDRILCMEIHKNGKDLVFLPDALADVDPIKTVHGLMGQRKRWINGSYFAFEKVKKEIGKTQQCQIILRLQVLFYDFLNIFIYFAPSIFFFTVHISLLAFRTDVLSQILKPIQSSKQVNQQFLDFFVYTIDLIYALILLTILFYSLTTTSNKPIYKPYIYFSSTVLGLLALGVFIVFLVDIIRGLTTGSLFLIQAGDVSESQTFKILLQANRWIVVGVFGIYIVPLLLYSILFKTAQPLIQALKASVSFVFYSPTYLIILGFYALCRIDDISWGTKGLNSQTQKQNKMQEKWKLIKLIHVGKYVLWNTVASVLLISFSQSKYPRFYIAFVIMISVVLTLVIKIIVGGIYMLAYKCQSMKCCGEIEDHQPRNSKMGQLISKYRDNLDDGVKGIIKDFKEIQQTDKCESYILSIRNLQSNIKLNKKAVDRLLEKNINKSNIVKQSRSNILMQQVSRIRERRPLPNIAEGVNQ